MTDEMKTVAPAELAEYLRIMADHAKVPYDAKHLVAAAELIDRLQREADRAWGPSHPDYDEMGQ